MTEPFVLRLCECHSPHHPGDGCGKLPVVRWGFPAERILPGEPGYLDLCQVCYREWSGHHGLTPGWLRWAEGASP